MSMRPFCIQYDLAVAPASWDFLAWLIFAEMRRIAGGYTHLEIWFKPGPISGFRDDPFPGGLGLKQQIYANVMLPLVHMVGGTLTTRAPEQRSHGYTLRQCIDGLKAGHKIRALRPSDPSVKTVQNWSNGEPFITITLRESEHWPERNSNLDAWREFAKAQDIKCIFIRDTSKALQTLPGGMNHCSAASCNLDLRLAFYNQAHLNLGVNNGPTSLLYFSTAPYLIFKSLVSSNPVCTATWWTTKVGVSPGGQFPWANKKQRLAWADDDFQTILDHYALWADSCQPSAC